MKALLSVSNKEGLVRFGTILVENGYELISTGGTAKELTDNGLTTLEVSEVTGFSEMLDGRVKTLHPFIHGGILARRNSPEHMNQLESMGIAAIDLVICNLYPFVETVNKARVELNDALENIDIGGPSMIRSAAKNFPHVIVVVDPEDYTWISEKLEGDQSISQTDRKKLATKAFRHIAMYDTAISQFLEDGDLLDGDESTFAFTKIKPLRYGENPHQVASLYNAPLSSGGIVNAEKLHGIDMSFTNYLDADSAFKIVHDFNEPAATIVKHTNPCGLAIHDDQPTAYKLAYEGDPTSAYGGILAFNRPLTTKTAESMRGVLFDIIIAPDFENDAVEILRKRKRTRILKTQKAKGPQENMDLRLLSGGALLQTTDVSQEEPDTWKIVTTRAPSTSETSDLHFAWKAAKHIKSNSIVLAKSGALVGMGAGQPNRVTSVHLALRSASLKAKGSALASDAFFPFSDSIEIAASEGITAVIQPGGSIRDNEVIQKANEHNITMVFTGTRHFKH